MNLRHPAPKAGALPSALHPDCYTIFIFFLFRCHRRTRGFRLLPANRFAFAPSLGSAPPFSSLHPPPAALGNVPICATSRYHFCHYNKPFAFCQGFLSTFIFKSFTKTQRKVERTSFLRRFPFPLLCGIL